MILTTMQQAFTALLLTHLTLFLGCGQGVQTVEDKSPNVPDHSVSISTRSLRQKRAPGWGKRSEEDVNTFQEDEDDEDLLNALDNNLLQDKRAPGWGKREELDTDKRAPGWGKRAPGWGKRAPGWGKRAPGWGKRAPGWGKRGVLSEEEEKRAPGWGKRAPGWGKRAPGWGKRAPGWGKRAMGGVEGECEVLGEELEFFLSRVIETEAKLRSLCGSHPTAFDLLSRK